jgi:dTDP-4-dehydrorhamnose 3,5-epimerase
VLRGVHVHVNHFDYLLIAAGAAVIALRDLRRHSPTHQMVSMVPMSGDDKAGLVIPPGVAHGFYFPTAGMHLYSVDHYWDPADELGCHWLDPGLEIPWPDREASVSPRDADAISLAELLDQLEPHQDALYPRG